MAVRFGSQTFALALWTMSSSLFLPACPGDEAPPPALSVSEDATRVRWTLSPFSFEVWDDSTETLVGKTQKAGGDCAPLMVALRPLDDEGRFHRPETPESGLIWLRSGNARLTDENEVEVELLDAQDKVQGEAGVEITKGEEGFVSLSVKWPFPETEIAMAGVCFELAEDEHVIGAGERFDGVDLVGRTIPLAFTLPGPFSSGTNESHAPVPYLTTSRGLGALVMSERVGAFDVGDGHSDAIAIRFHGNLPLLVRAGSVRENIAAHARIMGLPKAPPRWTLAPMQWRNELAVTVEDGEVISNGRDRFLDDAQTLRELGIPNTGIWIDAPWSTGYNTFAFNEVQFPEPESMIQEAEDLGFRVIVWATEYMNRSNDEDQMYGMPPFGSRELFESFSEEGWLVKGVQGDAPFVFGWGRGEGGFVDFTNPTAVAALQDLIRPILRMGVRGFKLDYGETMRADLLGLTANDAVRFFDGSTTATMHTRYARLYHEAFLSVLQEEHPDDNFIISRTGGIYDQKNGISIWPGDLDNNFDRAYEPQGDELAIGGLPAAISAALSLAASGYPLYGSDIGGYVGGAPTGECLLRWAQFAAFTPVMHLGGGGTGDTTHNPWDPRYGENAVAIYRQYARLHMDLLPTFEAVLLDASETGMPFLLPLGIFANDDAQAWEDIDAFSFAERWLVFPVVDEGATQREVYLPRGDWIDYWSGDMHEGAQKFEMEATLETMPVFVKAGSVLILGDPRLMTAVSAPDDDVADVDRYGSHRVVRTSAGETDHFKAIGFEGKQSSTENGLDVEIRSSEMRDVALQIWLRTDIGPSAQAEVRVDNMTPEEILTESEFWECEMPCTWRSATEIWVRTRGQNFATTLRDP